MNTHDIDTGLPYVAFCRVSDIDPHESHHRQLGVSADTRLYTEDQVLAAIEADRKLTTVSAKERFYAASGEAEVDPIERLRFYCALAMSAQDWLDVEPFFDAMVADRKRRGEPVAWVKQDIAENQFINMRPRRIWWECNEGIGMPIFAAPQPAEPTVKESLTVDEPVKKRPETTSEHIARDIREGRFPDKSERQTVPVEPEKVPSDEELIAWASEEQFFLFCDEDEFLDIARALLARYGQKVEPEGWQLVPKEPTEEMLEGTESYLINPDGEPVDIVRVTKSQYRELLAAAPKFGEEE